MNVDDQSQVHSHSKFWKSSSIPSVVHRPKNLIQILPQGYAATKRCAGLVQHMMAPEQAQKDTSPIKIDVTSKSPVGDISVVTLIRTDTALDHSQKAEKVCNILCESSTHSLCAAQGGAANFQGSTCL